MASYYGGAVVQVAELDPSYDADPGARIYPTADDDWLANYGRVDDPVAARICRRCGPTPRHWHSTSRTASSTTMTTATCGPG